MNQRLTTALLRRAYSLGYFPMPDHPPSQDILWFHPDDRAVFTVQPSSMRVSRSLRKTLRRREFVVTHDEAFTDVMRKCGEQRPEGTWVNDEFLAAYTALHREGDAHSLEVWDLDRSRLIGGIYGVHVPGTKVFCAESMFHRETDMSKVALFHLLEHLREHGFALLEVQFMTKHLESLGARAIPRDEYLRYLLPGTPTALS